MKNPVDEIMRAAQEFADERVMAVRGAASEESVYSAFVALRGVAESVHATVNDLHAHIAELERDKVRAIAENQKLARQLREVRPLISYGGSY